MSDVKYVTIEASTSIKRRQNGFRTPNVCGNTDTAIVGKNTNTSNAL